MQRLCKFSKIGERQSNRVSDFLAHVERYKTEINRSRNDIGLKSCKKKIKNYRIKTRWRRVTGVKKSGIAPAAYGPVRVNGS